MLDRLIPVCVLQAAVLLSYIPYAKGQPAWVAPSCIKQYSEQSVAILQSALPDANLILEKVASSIGLKVSVAAIPCGPARDAFSVEWDGTPQRTPAGAYVLYNPTWVRQVAGSDRVQLVALFGHELGHILDQHFSLRATLPRRTQEEEADEFAGCAVARLGGDWSRLVDLVSRLRAEKDELYPDRLTSLTAAKKGFDACNGSAASDPSVAMTLVPGLTRPLDGFALATPSPKLPEALPSGPVLPGGGTFRVVFQAKGPDKVAQVDRVLLDVIWHKPAPEIDIPYSFDPSRQSGFGSGKARVFNAVLNGPAPPKVVFLDEARKPINVTASNLLPNGTYLTLDSQSGLQEALDLNLAASAPGLYEVRLRAFITSPGGVNELGLGPIYIAVH